MARPQSRENFGYRPVNPAFYAAIFSAIKPARSKETRILDPFAGEGAFIAAAEHAWNVTAYANELDQDRASHCIRRLGPIRALQGDFRRLSASNAAFSFGWFNPPYDHNGIEGEEKRVELQYLKDSWRWIQEGGIAAWCVYKIHLTDAAIQFLSRHSSAVEVFELGTDQETFTQIVVFATVTHHANEPELAQPLREKLHRLKHDLPKLTVLDTPLLTMPESHHRPYFEFAQDVLTGEQALLLTTEHGPHLHPEFQRLIQPQPPQSVHRPIMQPRPGHLALALAQTTSESMVIETKTHGRALLRTTITHQEVRGRREVIGDPKDEQKRIERQFFSLKPTSSLALATGEGLHLLVGDDQILPFVKENREAISAFIQQHYAPHYQWDFAGVKRTLDSIRLGKSKLHLPQRHVAAAALVGLSTKQRVMLAGAMGTGKTALGATVIHTILRDRYKGIRHRKGTIAVVVAPPHLIPKWKRELLTIDAGLIVQDMRTVDKINDFMERAAASSKPHVMLIPRDATKLHCQWTPSVRWKTVYRPRWPHDKPPPAGQQPEHRIARKRVACCPRCDGVIVRRDGEDATEAFFAHAKRTCDHCQTPLWQEAPQPHQRQQGAIVKNPRYQLSTYLKDKYPGGVELLIWDESHEGKSASSGNGNALTRLANSAAYTLLLTGTPFDGKASGSYPTLHTLNRAIRQRYPRPGSRRLHAKVPGDKRWQALDDEDEDARYNAERAWVRDMGVLERLVESRPTFDPKTGKFTGRTEQEKPYEEAVGISPLLPITALDNTLFFSLKDMSDNLPEYEEILVPVRLPSDILRVYQKWDSEFRTYLAKLHWEGDVSFQGAYLRWAMNWPNAYWRDTTVKHQREGEVVRTFDTIPALQTEKLTPKEQELYRLCAEHLADNGRVLVFVQQTDSKDIQPRLEGILRQISGSKPYILSSHIDPAKREETIQKAVQGGAKILLCNPELVKTGLDLIQFTRIIFFEPTLQLSTMLQAAARHVRLNQTAKRCETIFMYYEGTMEARMTALMSRKQRAAKMFTGDLGLTGLDSLTDGIKDDLLNELAAEFASEDAIADPRTLLQQDTAETDLQQQDVAYWAVSTPDDVPETPPVPAPAAPPDRSEAVRQRLTRLGASPHLTSQLINSLFDGVTGILRIPGLNQQPTADQEQRLARWLASTLRSHNLCTADNAADEAQHLIQSGKGESVPGTTAHQDVTATTPAPAAPGSSHRYTLGQTVYLAANTYLTTSEQALMDTQARIIRRYQTRPAQGWRYENAYRIRLDHNGKLLDVFEYLLKDQPTGIPGVSRTEPLPVIPGVDAQGTIQLELDRRTSIANLYPILDELDASAFVLPPAVEVTETTQQPPQTVARRFGQLPPTGQTETPQSQPPATPTTPVRRFGQISTTAASPPPTPSASTNTLLSQPESTAAASTADTRETLITGAEPPASPPTRRFGQIAPTTTPPPPPASTRPFGQRLPDSSAATVSCPPTPPAEARHISQVTATDPLLSSTATSTLERTQAQHCEPTTPETPLPVRRKPRLDLSRAPE